jgi:hypothetical protein
VNVANPSRTRHTALTLVLAALASVLGIALTAGPASAESYRFWGYYHLTEGEWEFATTGNDGFTPEDGSVEGYRFAVAGPTDTRMPRATATFEQICGETPVAESQKRVGVMIDFGRDVDAPTPGANVPDPKAACAVVPDEATGADVLAQVAELRIEGGLVCAIEGYPETGCGDPVPDADVTSEMAAADEPIDFPALVNAEGETSDEVATDDASDPAEGAVDDNVPTWVWALVAAAVLAALVGVIAQRSRANRQDN